MSSLHDGMNLVAKEFVTARGDDRGVLVLSKFTGAARELPDAVLVEPVRRGRNGGRAFCRARRCPHGEQERRMRRMRPQVDDCNIYRWAGMPLSEVGKRCRNSNCNRRRHRMSMCGTRTRTRSRPRANGRLQTASPAKTTSTRCTCSECRKSRR